MLDPAAHLATWPLDGGKVAPAGEGAGVQLRQPSQVFHHPAVGREYALDVVIYEEDKLTRDLLREWLREAGYGVRRGVLDDAQCRSRASLVIASVYMPKHSGIGWLRDIHAAHAGVPVIAISGQFRSGLCPDGATAESLGVQQVIAKPLNRADLIAAVRAMIGTPS